MIEHSSTEGGHTLVGTTGAAKKCVIIPEDALKLYYFERFGGSFHFLSGHHWSHSHGYPNPQYSAKNTSLL
jgi:hypothetical protein